MKKSIFAILLTALFFTGCQDAVFPRIRTEVELENATKGGIVNSIVRYYDSEKKQEYLFMENGQIYYKSAEEADQRYNTWQMDGTLDYIKYDYVEDSFSGTYFIKLAANSDSLFALGVTYSTETGETQPDEKILFKKTSLESGWREIYRRKHDTIEDSASITEDNFTIFCTNAPKVEHRKAFARIDNKVYELTKDTDWTQAAPSDEIIGHGATSGSDDKLEYRQVNSVVYLVNNVYFFQTVASGTNETIEKDATYVYWGDGNELRFLKMSEINDDGNITKYSILNMGQTITCMAVTNDSILVGTNQYGAKRILYSSDDIGKPQSTVDFSTNAASTLTSPYNVNLLFSLFPQKNEEANVIYAAMNLSGTEVSTGATTEDVGLWAYYPERGNWNRE